MPRKKQKFKDSKKAIAVGVALANINLFIFIAVPFLKVPNDIIVQGITAVLFLIGIYTGVQGGIDMISANKHEFSREEEETVERKEKKVEIYEEVKQHIFIEGEGDAPEVKPFCSNACGDDELGEYNDFER